MAATGVRISDSTIGGVIGGMVLLVLLVALLIIVVKFIKRCKYKRKDIQGSESSRFE